MSRKFHAPVPSGGVRTMGQRVAPSCLKRQIALDIEYYQMISMMVTRKGGDLDEDGSTVDSGAGADQGTVGWLAGTGDHGQRVYSAFVGGTFQTGSCNEPERTVSDGASREKGSGLAQ